MIPPCTIRLAIVPSAPADSRCPLETVAHELGKVARLGANVAVLPELFNHRYPCQTEEIRHFDWAESIPGETTKRLSSLAKQHHLIIVGTIFERRSEGVYHNTAVVIDASCELVGRYRKLHVPNCPRYRESYFFMPGDLGFGCFDTTVGRLAIGICWNQWFPENDRMAAVQGARLLVFPTSVGWQDDESLEARRIQHDAWRTMLRSHAIANNLFVAAVNRVGPEEAIQFWGRSLFIAPVGSCCSKRRTTEWRRRSSHAILSKSTRFASNGPF